MDPITLQLYRHRFAGVSEEMGITLRRTSYSPNIKERLDFSCAVFDGQGHLIAQAAHIPAHLGAMPASVHTILEKFPDWDPGDVVIVNAENGEILNNISMDDPGDGNVRSTISAAHGQLFIRTNGKLYCVGK